MTPLRPTLDQLARHIGPLGYSGWRRISQQQVNLFADATDDHQWIHVDPDRAAEGPFGGTVAHGFLTLSLLPALTSEVLDVSGVVQAVNHRVDRVRFRAPVAVGARLRASVELLSVRPRPRGFTEVVVAVAMELDDRRIACTAEQTTLYLDGA
ncbi:MULTISPECIES: MaoC family dehydratase [unclassified Streptomyces]|uniref:MaoC family dehydratase n=1 Tax=unclassified Streptomyces TaxID=2593676 RepID=UPI0004C8613F|nr:MaoC family dehydratase [Streptomyces sp. NRRL F-5135]